LYAKPWGVSDIARELRLPKNSVFRILVTLVTLHAHGYVERGEEIDSLHCMVAPVFNHRGHPLAAFWVIGPSFRLREEDFPRLGRLLVEQVAVISHRFGSSVLDDKSHQG